MANRAARRANKKNAEAFREIVEAPDLDPDAMATVRYADLRELDAICTELRESLYDAKASLKKIAMVLDCQPAEEMTPEDLVNLAIIPSVKTLMLMKRQVDDYEAKLRAGVDQGKIEGDSDGPRGLALVGRRLPDEVMEKADKRRARAQRRR